MINCGTATLEDIRQAGVDALVRELGAVGMIRFLQQFETGRGDYTAERQRQDVPATPETVTALAEEIAAGGATGAAREVRREVVRGLGRRSER